MAEATLIILGSIAVSLTMAMFLSRQAMLGFAAAIFWFLFGAHCYTYSIATWDLYFLISFGSILGMGFLCIYGAFGLREKRDVDTDEDEFIDEQKPQKFFDETQKQANRAEGVSDSDFPDDNIDRPSQPSARTIELRKRARARKTGTTRKTRWGGFR